MFFAGGTVIRKEPLGPDAARRLQHEVAMLARLVGAAGVAQLAAGLRYPGSVVLADAGDTSLAGLAKPLPRTTSSGWQCRWPVRWRACTVGR